MERIKSWGWQAAGSPQRLPRRARLACALALNAASAALDRLARYLACADERANHCERGEIEFHAESGAPEGALYVDGRLIGWIDGVRRL